MPNSFFSVKTKVQIIQEGNIDSGLTRLKEKDVFSCSVPDFRQRIWEACKDGLEGEPLHPGDNLPNQFVGFIAMDEHLIISLPKVYDLDVFFTQSDAEQKKTCRILFQFMKKYTEWSEASKRKAARTINTFHQDRGEKNKKPASRLATAQKILNDFLENDLWNTNIRLYTQQSNGPISWSKTIQKTQSICSVSGVFYPHPVRMKKQPHNYHLLQQIHHWVVVQIFRNFGWLLTDVSCPLPPISKPASNMEMLHRARIQLRESFSDRDVRLWNAMVNYLDPDKRGNSEAVDIYGACAFHVVFEEACRRVFERKEHDHRYAQYFSTLNTTVKWNIVAPKREYENFGNRADILAPIEEEGSLIPIQITNRRFFVLDAKYYDFARIIRGATQRSTSYLYGAPSLSDIRKQYFYTQLVLSEKNKNIEEAKSAFLFPYVYETHDVQKVKHVGTVGFGMQNNTVFDEDIMLFGICLEWLFEQYCNLQEKDVLLFLEEMWKH